MITAIGFLVQVIDYRNGNEKRPEHWGELKKEWAACKYGKLQSPIDLSDDRATKVIPSLEDLQMSYKPCNATMKNEGHYIAMEWEGDAGSVKINGTDYFLKQCHWHSPSEHSINGIRYDLELHMLHRSPNPNNKAVVALLFKIGRPNPLLSKVNTVSKEQLELLKQAVYDYTKMNARPSQLLNDRDIILYSPLLRQPVLRN
ncbi:alpha carbonic anhydrase 4-like [Prunus yedoensis var. nudiflora]|uniref:Carbonic anhydrase n=1 Tax=Prunus yedoensis var. nudiflora TaxID=2094558 RepID=A0A314XPP0_PRUYE|nr:alpha carbonic anhydrase 4-like [Prunus yedoensis var. nudiflora]